MYILAGHGRIIVILAGRLHGRILTQNRNRIPDYRGGHVCNLGHPNNILPREASKRFFLGNLPSLSEADEKAEVSDYGTSCGRVLFHGHVHDPIRDPCPVHDRVLFPLWYS
jgi:hypothetical protein